MDRLGSRRGSHGLLLPGTAPSPLPGRCLCAAGEPLLPLGRRSGALVSEAPCVCPVHENQGLSLWGFGPLEGRCELWPGAVLLKVSWAQLVLGEAWMKLDCPDFSLGQNGDPALKALGLLVGLWFCGGEADGRSHFCVNLHLLRSKPRPCHQGLLPAQGRSECLPFLPWGGAGACP